METPVSSPGEHGSIGRYRRAFAAPHATRSRRVSACLVRRQIVGIDQIWIASTALSRCCVNYSIDQIQPIRFSIRRHEFCPRHRDAPAAFREHAEDYRQDFGVVPGALLLALTKIQDDAVFALFRNIRAEAFLTGRTVSLQADGSGVDWLVSKTLMCTNTSHLCSASCCQLWRCLYAQRNHSPTRASTPFPSSSGRVRKVR